MGNVVPWRHALGRHRCVFVFSIEKEWTLEIFYATAALGYSIIAPIMNGFACATFFMFYQLYKYLFLYVYQQPATTDTGGLFYPKAYQHVLVGMYVQQICLCALFFLSTDTQGRHSSVGEGALMVVLIVITVSNFFSFFFFPMFVKKGPTEIHIFRPGSMLSSTTRMIHSSKPFH